MRPEARRRAPALLAFVAALAGTACATGRTARHFAPATEDDARQALAAWGAARERAATLPPSRLLYDARLSSGGVPSVPGTLAVTYDKGAVVTASLSGPFGSRIAEYRSGSLTGEDRKAFVVDPEALRSVLAGTWNGAAPSVEGRDGGECLLAWTATNVRVTVVLDMTLETVRSMQLEASAGRLLVLYTGVPDPWPQRIALRDEKTGRGLALKLVAIEAIPPREVGR